MAAESVIAMQAPQTKTWTHIQQGTLDIEAVVQFLQVPNAGGIDIFIGTTRQWTEGRETVHLEYDCYPAMALKEMERLAQVACERWPVEQVCVLHRTGIVEIGEASVIIGVATPHRADAFAACRFLIDTLKQQVPIWKREVYADGEAEWIEGTSVPQIGE